MTVFLRLATILLAVAVLNVTATPALADCVNPPGVERDIIYNTDFHVPQYCNGTDWIAFGALNPASGSGSCSNPDGPEGKILYNADFHVLQYCDGTSWKAVGGSSSCGGSPEGCLLPWGGALSGGYSVTAYETATVPFGNTCNGENRTCDGGDLSGSFTFPSCTEDGQDSTPDAFSFTDQTDVALSTLVSSNTVTINGITGSVSVSVSGDGSPQININGGSWVTSGTITDGQTLQLRLTSNASYDVMNSATATVGTASEQWDVTTEAEEVCGSGPVAHWKLDESSGTTAADSAGSNDGTLANGPVWQPTGGRFDGALLFDGSNDRLNITHDSALNFGTGDFSIGGWVRTNYSLENDEWPKFYEKVGSGPDRGIYLNTSGSDDDDFPICELLGTGGTHVANATGVSVRDNVWHHIMCVKDSGGAKIYVDGLERGSVAASIGSIDNTANAAVGWSRRWGSDYFQGRIDDVRIYDRALDGDEVAALYDSTSCH